MDNLYEVVLVKTKKLYIHAKDPINAQKKAIQLDNAKPDWVYDKMTIEIQPYKD